MAPGSFLDLSYSIWPDLYGNPKKYVDNVTKKAGEAVANGASVLIPSALPLGLWLLQQGINEINGAQVLDSLGCALKMAELMVDLRKIGIQRAAYGPTQKEMLKMIQDQYSG